jgi:hypothetical protein
MGHWTSHYVLVHQWALQQPLTAVNVSCHVSFTCGSAMSDFMSIRRKCPINIHCKKPTKISRDFTIQTRSRYFTEFERKSRGFVLTTPF